MKHYGDGLSVKLENGYMLLKYPNVGRRIIVNGTDTSVVRNLRVGLSNGEYSVVFDALISSQNYFLVGLVVRALERSQNFSQGGRGKSEKIRLLTKTREKLIRGNGSCEGGLERAIILIEKKIEILDARSTKKLGRCVFNGRVNGVGTSLLAYDF